jgi:hypothetical protein
MLDTAQIEVPAFLVLQIRQGFHSAVIFRPLQF